MGFPHDPFWNCFVLVYTSKFFCVSQFHHDLLSNGTGNSSRERASCVCSHRPPRVSYYNKHVCELYDEVCLWPQRPTISGKLDCTKSGGVWVSSIWWWLRQRSGNCCSRSVFTPEQWFKRTIHTYIQNLLENSSNLYVFQFLIHILGRDSLWGNYIILFLTEKNKTNENLSQSFSSENI